MSGSRSTLAAVGVALVLGGAVWGWNTKLKPQREKAKEEAKKLFPGLEAGGTTELLLRKRGSADVLLRKIDGHWHLIQPIQAPADEAAVATLVKELGEAKRDEVVVEKDAVLHDFGLDEPSGGITFLPASPGAKAQVLFFGLDHPLGTQAYGMVDGKPQVFLTAMSAKSALLKDAASLRDKAVWDLDPDAVIAVRSSFAGGSQLTRDAKGFWTVNALGHREPGKPAEVGRWLGQLAGLKAESVPSETGKGSFGLAASKRLQLTLKDGRTLSLVAGGKAASGGFHVQVGGKGPVYVLGEASRPAIERSGKDLMDLQAFSFNTGEVERFEIDLGGKHLAAAKKLGAWAWEGAAPKAANGKEFDFQAFLLRLANTELLKRLDKNAKPGKAAASVTLYSASGALLEKAEFGPRLGGAQVAISAMKNQVALVAGNLLDGLPDPGPSGTTNTAKPKP